MRSRAPAVATVLRWRNNSGVSHTRHSEPFLATWLRGRIKSHNRQALTYARLSAAGAIAGWTFLYSAGRWLALLFETIYHGPYAPSSSGFDLGFIAIASALMVSAWVDRRFTPNAAPPDEKAPTEIAMDLLLAVPRATLAIPANFAAWVRLPRTDLSAAASLLETLIKSQRIPIYELPVEIPVEARRKRVLDALSLLEVIEFQREAGSSLWVKVAPTVRAALEKANLTRLL